MKVTIRESNPKDRDKLSQLMFRFGQFYESIDNMKRIHFSNDHEPAYTDQMILNATTNNGKIYVAEINGQIVGLISGYIQKLTKLEKNGLVKTKPGIISEIYIDEPYRKNGIGEILLGKMENYFKKQKCDVIITGVLVPNINARRFYEMHGYKEREIELIKKLD